MRVCGCPLSLHTYKWSLIHQVPWIHWHRLWRLPWLLCEIPTKQDHKRFCNGSPAGKFFDSSSWHLGFRNNLKTILDMSVTYRENGRPNPTTGDNLQLSFILQWQYPAYKNANPKEKQQKSHPRLRHCQDRQVNIDGAPVCNLATHHSCLLLCHAFVQVCQSTATGKTTGLLDGQQGSQPSKSTIPTWIRLW